MPMLAMAWMEPRPHIGPQGRGHPDFGAKGRRRQSKEAEHERQPVPTGGDLSGGGVAVWGLGEENKP
jgi:hypothetical protein